MYTFSRIIIEIVLDCGAEGFGFEPSSDHRRKYSLYSPSSECVHFGDGDVGWGFNGSERRVMDSTYHMGHTMRKRVFGHMRTAKAQISLRIRTV